MSDTILAGDLTVYYGAENRRKQIRWTGGSLKTNVQKMIAVYDASEDLFSDPVQMDDGSIFSAETPGEYTIGKIDAGELDPWFIDIATLEHIIGDFANFTGCALKTSGWARVQDSNVGIVVVAVTSASNNIVIGDIGFDITHADGDAGTLLDVIVTGGATDYLWIRPDTDAVGNNFDSTSLNLTCNAHTAPQEAAAVTGEMIWSNPFTQGGGISGSDTHVYLYQNGVRVFKVESTTEDWWVDGHVDRAVPITDYTTAAFPVIDQGFLTVLAHKYTDKNSFAIIRMNSVSGGNVSAPLATGVDGNNTTGYSSILLGGGTGNWVVGNEITGDTSNARGIITLVSGSNPTPTLHYYLVGDPLTDFNGTEAITNEDDTGAATSSGAPAAQGPALAGWFDGAAAPTIVFANTTSDIDEVGGAEPYAMTGDINLCSLAQWYEWAKYVARRGSTFDLDGLDGQEFIGIDYRVDYTGAVTGTVSEGATVTGVTSGATGVVVSHHLTEKIAMLRNSRGTFVDAEQIQVDGGNFIPASGTTVTALTPIAECWAGTLAGGAFFGTIGLLLADFKTAEENSFTLIDCDGVPRLRPISITVTQENLLNHDWASLWRLTGSGGSIDKAEYTAAGGEAIGATTVVITGGIAVDVAGKATGGRILVVDVTDSDKEYVLRYSSWASSTFTLANVDIPTAEGATETTILDTGSFANTEVGDLVINHSRAEAVSYVTQVVDDDNVVISPAITSQTTGDDIELNVVPVAITSSDQVYVAIILSFVETAQTEKTASFQYDADINARARVRNTSSAAIKIKPFTQDILITTQGGASITGRIPNTVYGS